MHWIDWLILSVPLTVILWLAVYSRKFVRGIADFLAAGRVAGRYVISVGDLQSGMALIFLVGLCEQEYQCGMAVGFWGKLIIPISIFMSLTGYIVYRYRQTRALSMGQFLETRYNRPFRIVAAFIRTLAEMMTNAIGPAVAARFFIYFMGLPLTFHLFGWQVSTFAAVMLLVLLLAMLVIWPGGRISLLITDSIQGLMSYPIFVIFTCFVLSEISWHFDVAPVMLDRVPGESFLNPLDIESLRDFNLFALIVTILSSLLNRGAWIGNDSSGSGRTAHEQKMAGILGAWRNGFASLMMTLVALFLVTVMHSGRFAEKARNIRLDLVNKVAEETIPNAKIRDHVLSESRAIPAANHKIGADQPYSRKYNPDLPYLNTVQMALQKAAETEIERSKILQKSSEAEDIRGAHNTVFQKFRTLYYQMMMPTLLRRELPLGLMGLFLLLMVMLMLSSDDSRIFNASSTLVQDIVMPLRKKPFEKSEHLTWLRGMSLAVCVFFFLVSLLFAQIDYIVMFINVVCALWLGAAGPIMIGGLYTRWGTTTGAFCALVFGSGTSLAGLLCQRYWAKIIYPFLMETGYLNYVNSFFSLVTELCSPLVVWEVNPYKFPINSFEIYFLAMVFGCAAYVIGSLLTCRKPYDLDRMLHRGNFADEKARPPSVWTWKNIYSKLIGITEEYTRGDRIIAWSVFFYSIVYQFLIAFVAVAVWNIFDPWSAQWWSWYFFITVVVAGIAVGVVSTVWFMWGGIVDMKRLFRDLNKRVDNPLDDGWVENNLSLVDRSQPEMINKNSDDEKKSHDF